MRFADWTPSAPARVVDLRSDLALVQLANYYEGARPGVAHEVFGQAYTLGAQTAIIEYRYLDANYRSEHSSFYSITFRRYPSVAHRIHFFAQEQPDELADPNAVLDFSTMSDNYLGFVVLRPVPGAPIGRVALAPPSQFASEVTCITEERTNVFGVPMRVGSAPFMAQDSQLGVCAHMSLWTAARHHHLAFGHPDFTVAAIAESIPAEMGRVAPSTGLTVHQLAAGCRALGLPALIYKCDPLQDLPAEESIPRIACRYLNSGMPVIVAAGSRHAFCVVGYTRVHAGTSDERIHFIRQDDERGPYQVVEDFAHDDYGTWQYLIVPLPSKIFVPGETAESLGKETLIAAAAGATDPAAADIAEAGRDERGLITFRSAVVRSNRFKEGLPERGYAPEIVARYRRLPMPRWLWVVEAVRRPERNNRAKAVVGEALIDATDHGRDMNVLAWHVPGELGMWNPDEDQSSTVVVPTQDVVETVARYIYDKPLSKPPA